jgi:hypothetical protein
MTTLTEAACCPIFIYDMKEDFKSILILIIIMYVVDCKH